jgi:hypothetical protein
MNKTVHEDPRLAWKLIARPVLLGYIAIAGILVYYRFTRMHDNGKLLFCLGFIAGIFALIFISIAIYIRPKGTWNLTDDGLKFISFSGMTQWTISWEAISRMDNTSVSLVIWWIDASEVADKPKKRRAVLLLPKPDAAEVVSLWRSHRVKI